MTIRFKLNQDGTVNGAPQRRAISRQPVWHRRCREARSAPSCNAVPISCRPRNTTSGAKSRCGSARRDERLRHRQRRYLRPQFDPTIETFDSQEHHHDGSRHRRRRRRRRAALHGKPGALASSPSLPRAQRWPMPVDRAEALIELDVTQGNVQPLPIAIPTFIGGTPDGRAARRRRLRRDRGGSEALGAVPAARSGRPSSRRSPAPTRRRASRTGP